MDDCKVEDTEETETNSKQKMFLKSQWKNFQPSSRSLGNLCVSRCNYNMSLN